MFYLFLFLVDFIQAASFKKLYRIIPEPTNIVNIIHDHITNTLTEKFTPNINF